VSKEAPVPDHGIAVVPEDTENQKPGSQSLPGKLFPWQAWICVAVIVALGAVFRSSCLNPDSLWLDDVWQALLCRASLSDQLRFSSSSPIGFTIILGLLSRLVPDAELGFQLPIFVLGVLQIPLFALLIYRISRSEALTAWGAALSAVCFYFVVFSTRVKQFTLDAVIVTLALLYFHKLWNGSRGIALASALGCCVLVLSFSSSIVIAIFLNVFLLRELIKNRGQWSMVCKPVSAVLIYNTVAAGYYFALLRHQQNPALSEFWTYWFIPWDKNLFEILAFTGNRFGVLLTGFWHNKVFLWDKAAPIPQIELIVLLLASAATILGLIRFRKQKGLDCYWAVAVTLVYLSLVTLAGLHIFPLGGRRTDIFTIPITLMTILIGAHSLCRASNKQWLTRLLLGGAVAYTILFGSPRFFGGYPVYPYKDRTAELTMLAEQDFKDDDVMIIYPHGCFAFGYYTTMPITLESSTNQATGFRVRVMNDRVFVLPLVPGYQRQPEKLASALDPVLENAEGRVITFGTHGIQEAIDYLNRRILATGRTHVFGEFGGSCFVNKYSRPKISEATRPPEPSR
jgi:hypothetical protein